MAVDPRITKAKKALRAGIKKGLDREAQAPNRATGTRARYKDGYEAAKEALAILDAKG